MGEWADENQGYDTPARRLRLVEINAIAAKTKADDLDRRVVKIEATDPAVMASTLATLVDDVRGLRIALYTFALSVVGGSLLFALTASKFFH